MSTAPIQISGLRRQTITSLKSQAKAQGLSVERYVKEIIETEMSMSEMARRKTIDEVFAPAQKQFRENGMSETELDRLTTGRSSPRGERNAEMPTSLFR